MSKHFVSSSDRAGESGNGSDLRHAPPVFTNDGGQRVIFVDFVSANYEFVFDIEVREALVNSTILFYADSPGFPVISLRQPFTSIQLDGEALELHDQSAPDGEASFKMLNKSVAAGKHELKIISSIEEAGPRAFPIKWLANPGRLHCIFGMSDIRRDGGFLEAYAPSNYEYDHFQMTFSVKVINSTVDHAVFTNGTATSTITDTWNIEFPDFYTTSCPWFHLGPSEEYETLRSTFASSDGRSIPILVYASLAQIQSGLQLERFRDRAQSALKELEADFGPFPHETVTVFAIGMGQGGMEYAGATATRLGSLRHELDHSYFARSTTPANGDAGWMDEAIASWGDVEHSRSATPPRRTSNLGKRSAYIRTTSRDAYTIGRDFLAHLDFVLRDKGGLKPMLAELAARKRHATITAQEFQSLVESFHGASLEDLFNTYIYAAAPTPFEDETAVAEAANPHHLSMAELLNAAFPEVDN